MKQTKTRAASEAPVSPGRATAPWVRAVVDWFGAEHRAMPWRDAPTPYAVWVSEIMLQQTQVDTVMPYFTRFISAFPSVQHLAAADEQAVLKLWEGLGYYARARNLHRAAQVVMHELDGKIPRSAEALRMLPGIGPYAAAAIASIAYGEAVPAVDGNVLRVMARLRGCTDNIARPATRNATYAYLLPHICTTDASAFNQALMELGALICKPRNPLCANCPVAKWCVARRDDRVQELPVKTRPQMTPHYDAAVLILRRRGRVLLAKRRAGGMLAGLWEFPSGRRKGRESLAATATRVAEAATGLHASPGPRMARFSHAYSHFRLTLHVFTSPAVGRAHPAGDYDTLEWVPVSKLETYPLTGVARKVIAAQTLAA